MILTQQQHFSQKSIKKKKKYEERNKKKQQLQKGMRIPRNRKTISPLKHFFSAESRDGLIAFFASPLRPPLSLLLYSLLHPNFRCTRLQFFATSWPALHAESTSGSVFSSLNRGVYIYIYVHECRSKYKEREKKNKKKMKKKKKDREKRFHPRKFLP